MANGPLDVEDSIRIPTAGSTHEKHEGLANHKLQSHLDLALTPLMLAGMSPGSSARIVSDHPRAKNQPTRFSFHRLS